jgi:hypothetical protein
LEKAALVEKISKVYMLKVISKSNFFSFKLEALADETLKARLIGIMDEYCEANISRFVNLVSRHL